MTPLPLKEIQALIAQNLPSSMSYAKKRVKIGKGNKKRIELKTAGASDDKMFFIVCYNSPVTRMEIMTPGIPEHLSRTTAILKIILTHFFPDWTGGDWLTDTVTAIEDNKSLKMDYEGFGLKVGRLDVYEQRIVMVDVS